MRLTDIQAVTFRAGEYADRVRSTNQLTMQCTKGDACRSTHSFHPTTAMCENKGSDGVRAQWRCEFPELNQAVRIPEFTVRCEGWSYPGDPMIRPGSCILDYSLEWMQRDRTNDAPVSTGSHLWSDMAYLAFRLIASLLNLIEDVISMLFHLGYRAGMVIRNGLIVLVFVAACFVLIPWTGLGIFCRTFTEFFFRRPPLPMNAPVEPIFAESPKAPSMTQPRTAVVYGSATSDEPVYTPTAQQTQTAVVYGSATSSEEQVVYSSTPKSVEPVHLETRTSVVYGTASSSEEPRTSLRLRAKEQEKQAGSNVVYGTASSDAGEKPKKPKTRQDSARTQVVYGSALSD